LTPTPTPAQDWAAAGQAAEPQHQRLGRGCANAALALAARDTASPARDTAVAYGAAGAWETEGAAGARLIQRGLHLDPSNAALWAKLKVQDAQ